MQGTDAVYSEMSFLEEILHIKERKPGCGDFLDMMTLYIERNKSINQYQETLFGERQLKIVNSSRFFNECLEILIKKYPQISQKIALWVDIDDVDLGIDIALSSCLILNELVENSLVHAFPHGKKGLIHVIFRKYGEYLVLEVMDDGVGFDISIKDMKKANDTGYGLIVRLSEYLKGSFKFNGNSGTCCTIAFRNRLHHMTAETNA